MNYRELLKKYLTHIVQEESIDFLDGAESSFTKEEYQELLKISEEVYGPREG